MTRTSVVANAEQKGWTVLSSRNEVRLVADGRHRGEADLPLAFLRERPVAESVAGVRRGRDQRDELALEPVEDDLDLGRRSSGLEVVQQDVVGIVGGLEACDVLALQLELAVEPWAKGCVVVLLSRDHPCLHALGGRLGQRTGELGRNPPRLLPVTAGDANQAGIVRVVREGGLVVAQLVDELADALIAEPLVGDSLHGSEALGADCRPRRRHHDHLIPLEQRKRRAEVGHFSEPEP